MSLAVRVAPRDVLKRFLFSRLLKEIATSIERYLHDSTQPYHQAVATELCSRGFATWQNYVDAMSLTRQLFAIAIGSDPNTSNDLRLLARNATLHVAGVNTPLLMTTLLFDILNTPDAVTRNATLKLLGFMIRKVGRRSRCLTSAATIADRLTSRRNLSSSTPICRALWTR